MKQIPHLPLFLFTLACVITPCASAAPKTQAKAADRSPAAPLVSAVSTVTGVAISPLLGTGAYGAYQWTAAKDDAAREALPWYAHWSFFGPALLIVLACAAKDTLGAAIPGLKKPLDVLEVVENKASGLVAAGAVVPLTMASVSKMMVGGKTAAGVIALPGGLAMLHLASIDLSWLLDILTIPFGVAMFALVWMASHAITVLILLSPWGAIDTFLKAIRTALLGLLTLTAAINPWVGAVLSLVVVVIAYLVAGWAFRLTVFGSVFCWDFFTGAKHRFTPAEDNNAMFSGAHLEKVPVRTFGRLSRGTAGELEFAYRPWLVLSERRAKIDQASSELAVGRGLFVSNISTSDNNTLFLLPPRYRGHEEAIARNYALGGGVREAGLRKAWSSLKQLFGGGTKTKVPA